VQRRHLARAHLVQDFSRLCVRTWIAAHRLKRREPAQRAARHAGIAPQHFDCGDQPVTPERGRVPGDARIRVAALRRIGHQHAEIRGGAAEDLVEQVVRGFHRRDVARLLADFPMRGKQAAQERRRALADRLPATCQQEDRACFVRRKNESICRGIRRQFIRLRIEGDRRAPPFVVEALVTQQDLTAADDLARGHARRARRSPRTSNRSAKSFLNSNESDTSMGRSPWLRTAMR